MRYISTCITALVLLAGAPAAAQSVDHTDVVRAVRAAAIAAGVDVDSSECARFEVTKHTAVQLAGEGAGLLEKLTGNNCQGRSVDIIAYPNGRIIDILGSGNEGPNTPHWLEQAAVDPARWRAPFQADFPTQGTLGEPVTPAPAPEPPASVEDHDAPLHRIEAQLEQLRTELAALRQAEADEHAATRAEIKAFREAAKKASNRALELLPSIISGLSFLRR